MPKLEPIPIPRSQRWRQFRTTKLPGIVMTVVMICVAYLWSQVASPRGIVGEVGAVTAQVASPRMGSLAELQVEAFQEVSTGAPIATIITTPPDVMAASLAMIQAEIDLLRLDFQPRFNRDRNALQFEQLKLDWMQQRADLARAKVALLRAENDLRRNEALFEEKVVSEDAAESSRTTRDALMAEVEERVALVENLGESLQRLSHVGSNAFQDSSEDVLAAAIRVQEQNLRKTEAQMEPLVLTAPISGQVRRIHRRSGEMVSAGEPIVTISSAVPGKILAYLTEPIHVTPQIGMEVEVTARSGLRPAGRGTITMIGSQIEVITNAFLLNTPRPKKGLPLYVSLPPELNSRPGELVDLRLLP